jgi:alginate O-acetyltransferase complex protein AlgI
MFLFLFLPLVLAIYLPLGTKGRTFVLLFASLAYYAGYNIFYITWEGGKGGSGFLPLLVYYITANYFLGLLAARHRETPWGRLVVCLSLALNLGPLAWYKYSGFALHLLQGMLHLAGENTLFKYQPRFVPLGISFFAFQAIAYVLDVHREEIEPERRPLRFALFLALFPKITAGPIIRYPEVAEDLDNQKLSVDHFAQGIERFVVGLGKKVLLADTLGLTANHVFSIAGTELPATIAWLGLLAYTLQIYLDFSGYTDMAIGLGRMFGFRFQENFNYPYISRSLTEFWRRWHISLSTWLRDYLFIPLSYALMTEGVRKKIAQGKYAANYRTAFSIVVVFTVCGLWHGAGWNYIAWGMLHGIVLALENLWLAKTMKKWWAPLQHLYLLLIVMLAWVFFRAPSIGAALDYLGALAGLFGVSGGQCDVWMYIDSTEFLALVAGIMVCMPTAGAISDRLDRRGYHAVGAFCKIAGMLTVIVMSFCTVASSTFTPFLYQKY